MLDQKLFEPVLESGVEFYVYNGNLNIDKLEFNNGNQLFYYEDMCLGNYKSALDYLESIDINPYFGESFLTYSAQTFYKN